ncbi:MAG: MFS transporter, partial [Planctomycetes bacterium]|nr:MFS transporter [Planctomycetota bacterium]
MSAAVRRKLLFAALYFAEGAPIGWLWWALPSQLARAGWSAEDITALTAALALPWAGKFLWAPLVDIVRTRWFGVRGWLVLAQLGMAATLLPMLALDPVADATAVFGWLLAHAFCAATQDVAIDALAIRSVPAAERGAINGAMQIGQIGGRVL